MGASVTTGKNAWIHGPFKREANPDMESIEIGAFLYLQATWSHQNHEFVSKIKNEEVLVWCITYLQDHLLLVFL